MKKYYIVLESEKAEGFEHDGTIVNVYSNRKEAEKAFKKNTDKNISMLLVIVPAKAESNFYNFLKTGNLPDGKHYCINRETLLYKL